MFLKDNFPYPFRFNPWKHHHQWILQHVDLLVNNPANKKLKAEIIANIKSINSNYVDIYTGIKTPEEITLDIYHQLGEQNALEKKAFSLWLEQKEFHLLTISDQSIWVLREGLEEERFIHIHPARNAPNIIRLHGNSWKTAVMVKTHGYSFNTMSVREINEIRINILGLSPLKNLEKSQRLISAFKLLQL